MYKVNAEQSALCVCQITKVVKIYRFLYKGLLYQLVVFTNLIKESHNHKKLENFRNRNSNTACNNKVLKVGSVRFP